MKIKHENLVKLISNMQLPRSEDFNKLFLLTKKEDLVRDFLLVEIEREIRISNNEYNYIAYPEWKKHDCVLLKKQKEKAYVPNCLIEFKYAKSPFIIDRKKVNLTEVSKSHDSIWIENFRPSDTGIGRGTKADLMKMIDTSKDIEEKGYEKPDIHQVIIIAMSNSKITDQLYYPIYPRTKKSDNTLVVQNDFVNYKNHLEPYKESNDKQLEDVKEIITNQFAVIHRSYFSEFKFKSSFTSLPLGKAFGTDLELHFFVMSLE
jgi:hypothetical protein